MENHGLVFLTFFGNLDAKPMFKLYVYTLSLFFPEGLLPDVWQQRKVE